MVMVGAGALAPFLIRAHAPSGRSRDVAIWNHRPERAAALAAELARAGLAGPRPPTDLEAAVREADIVSCATLSSNAARARRMAEAGRACRSASAPSSPRCARPTTMRAPRRVFCRHPRRRLEGRRRPRAAAGRRRHREGDVRGDLFDLCRGTVRAAPRPTRSRCSSRSARRSRISRPPCSSGDGSAEARQRARGRPCLPVTRAALHAMETPDRNRPG